MLYEITYIYPTSGHYGDAIGTIVSVEDRFCKHLLGNRKNITHTHLSGNIVYSPDKITLIDSFYFPVDVRKVSQYYLARKLAKQLSNRKEGK